MHPLRKLRESGKPTLDQVRNVTTSPSLPAAIFGVKNALVAVRSSLRLFPLEIEQAPGDFSAIDRSSSGFAIKVSVAPVEPLTNGSVSETNASA